jgi:Domain of unknown function (DUF4168)
MRDVSLGAPSAGPAAANRNRLGRRGARLSAWKTHPRFGVYQVKSGPLWKGILVRKMLLTAAFAFVLAASAPVWAQAQPEFSDQQLESFVVAAIAVDEVIREWNPRIQAAEDDAQAAQLREQANSELVEVITRTDGITMEQYQQIGRAAQADPDLAARINKIYQAKSGN